MLDGVQKMSHSLVCCERRDDTCRLVYYPTGLHSRGGRWRNFTRTASRRNVLLPLLPSDSGASRPCLPRPSAMRRPERFLASPPPPPPPPPPTLVPHGAEEGRRCEDAEETCGRQNPGKKLREATGEEASPSEMTTAANRHLNDSPITMTGGRILKYQGRQNCTGHEPKRRRSPHG